MRSDLALIAVIENAIRRADEWRKRDRSERDAGTGEEHDTSDQHRTIPAEASKNAVRIALQGDIAVIPIGAVMQLLQIEARSGLLMVTDGKTEISMSIRQGLIDLVQARGAGTEFRLGRYFVELGLVTTDDITRILRDNAPSPGSKPPMPESGNRTVAARPEESPTAARRLLGDLLVGSGRVTPDQLKEALARQSSELVYEVLRWPRGRFEFRLDGQPALAESAQLALPVASVVMEGFRRVDEWRLVESGLGSFESILQQDAVAIDANDIARLQKHEQKLLAMVDGKRSVRDIIEQSHMSSFDACKVLYQLLEARLVRRRQN
jgi:hypothetical protein